MKIAIHHRAGSFSDRWIEYCKEKGIPFKLVNAYDTDIVQQVDDCDAFMWHFHHHNYKDDLFAKQLIFSLQSAGKKCYPDINSCWHFDDKVGQKYLLESIGAPLIPSYVFYTKQDVFNWMSKTTFPKVFKLRGGAGAQNVQLVRDSNVAKKLINIAFGKGFSQYSSFRELKDRFGKWKAGKASFSYFCKGISKLVITPPYAKMLQKEKGYVYFQEFASGNNHDLRVVVVGNKLIGEKRYCREGDFRASGSGRFEYSDIPEEVQKIAFEVSEKLKMQSVAFDFIYFDGKPMIIEMSYGFGTHGISNCPGYYTRDYQYHQEKPDFCGWMVDNLIK